MSHAILNMHGGQSHTSNLWEVQNQHCFEYQSNGICFYRHNNSNILGGACCVQSSSVLLHSAGTESCLHTGQCQCVSEWSQSLTEAQQTHISLQSNRRNLSGILFFFQCLFYLNVSLVQKLPHLIQMKFNYISSSAIIRSKSFVMGGEEEMRQVGASWLKPL